MASLYRTEAPFGAWASPITAKLIASNQIFPGELLLVGPDILWSETRPAEGGRTVVVRVRPDGQLTDAIPPGFNARTTVHEYGGGAWTADLETVWFSNHPELQVYRCDNGSAPRRITPVNRCRYAALTCDPTRPRLYAVQEDHTDSDIRAVTSLVALSADGNDPLRVLASGRDFYSAPRPSPDGGHLAWLEWDHPNMPWDGTELKLARVGRDGSLEPATTIAGSPSEWISQPRWSPAGKLHFLSDRSGWSNVYRWTGETSEPLLPMEGEFCRPDWLFGMSSWGFESERVLVAAITRDGQDRLGRVNSRQGTIEFVPTPYTVLAHVAVDASRILVIGGSPSEPISVARLDPRTGAPEILRRSLDVEIDPRYLSRPRPIKFPTGNGQSAFGLFYLPENPYFSAPNGEKPPLLVWVHGGPTGQAPSFLDLGTQYFTSRGFAVLFVNYGGSTGYGRAFRDRLNGNWGIVDVEDTANGASYLVREGLVDGRRLVIRGQSAGGYTTLCALAFRDEFCAGISHYGVSDLLEFSKETHKFESRYMERLVGVLPESEEIYRARSPIHHLEGVHRPLLLFQGLDDRVVRPEQATRIFEMLRSRGIPVAYLPFPGEGHGFRKSENQQRVLEATLYFLSRIFGFMPADHIEPIPIENAPADPPSGSPGP